MEKRDEWDATPPIQRVTQSIDARLIQLTAKPDKSGGDFKEIDLLTRQLKKLNDGQGEQAVSGKKPRRRKLKNHFTEEQIVALREKSCRHWPGISANGTTTAITATA